MLIIVWPTPEQNQGSELEIRIASLEQLWQLVNQQPILHGYCSEISAAEDASGEAFLVVAYVATAD